MLLLALLRYVVYLGPHPVGHAELAIDGSGARTFSFAFCDRSLGPTLRQEIAVDAAGVPTAVRVRGTDYDHNRVDERYARPVGERGFYVSAQGLPIDAALLARALRDMPDGTLPLVGGGAARLTRGETLTLTAGTRRARVTLYAIAGLDFAPAFVWLDEAGELFAGGTVLRDVWHASVPALEAAERRMADARRGRLATLARTPSGPVAIVDARLFDSVTARVVPHTTVVFAGDRILAVGRDGAVALPSGAEASTRRARRCCPGCGICTRTLAPTTASCSWPPA